MAGLVLSLYADVGARIAPYVYATDAQGAGEGDHGGWGIVGTPLPRAFGELLFSKGTRPGRNVTKLDGTQAAQVCARTHACGLHDVDEHHLVGWGTAPDHACELAVCRVAGGLGWIYGKACL